MINHSACFRVKKGVESAFMIVADCISDFTMSYGLPVSLFLAGLVGGFTHCAGMCSPFVLAQTSAGPQCKRLHGALLIPYHLGRMTTYVVLAVLLSGFINLAFLFSDLRMLVTAPLLMLAGVLFLVTAFPVLGVLFPWAARLQVGVTFEFLKRGIAKLLDYPGLFQRYALGVLLGFMPCGLVLSALMAASTASTSINAGFAMAAFAVGTMPALMLLGIGGGALKHKYPKISKRFSQGAMTVSAIWLFALAGMLVF